jgi:mannosyltransferase OCH1-like enzyme
MTETTENNTDYVPECAKSLYFSKYIHFLPDEFTFKETSQLTIEQQENNIPRILHLIWVGRAQQPHYVAKYVEKWRLLLPTTWEVRMWTNDDITTKEFPLEAVYLIERTKRGAQKADIMRYFIMKKYGGVYVDTDITPHRSLEPLITQLPNAEVILCHDLPLTWKYISIGFFAAVPNHPLFITACNLCLTSQINTLDLHMHTGPRLIGKAVSMTTTEKKMVLLPKKFFYRNENVDERFGNHFYAKMW